MAEREENRQCVDVEGLCNDDHKHNDGVPLPLSPASHQRADTTSQCTIVYYWCKTKCSTIFMHVDVSSYNSLSKVIYAFFISVVVLCVVNNIVSSLPTFQYVPRMCSSPVCDNDPVLCPQREICAPITAPVFDQIDNVCIWIFTLEYGLRIGTCWSVSPIIAGLVDINVVQIPNYGPLEQTGRFIVRVQNLIDLAAITPYYVSFFVDLVGSTTYLVRTLRLLRLARILRLLRVVKSFEKFNITAKLLQEAVRNSWPVLGLFLFYGVLTLVLMGCIMYICEQGSYTISAEYPHGAWTRKAADGYHRYVSAWMGWVGVETVEALSMHPSRPLMFTRHHPKRGLALRLDSDGFLLGRGHCVHRWVRRLGPHIRPGQSGRQPVLRTGSDWHRHPCRGFGDGVQSVI